MRRHGLIAALLTLGFGCGGEDAPQPIALQSGAHRVEITSSGEIAFFRGANVLFTLGADAFELGIVRELDPALSYDPYWLVHEDALFTPDPPDDLVWVGVERAEVHSAELELTFDGNHRGTLSIVADSADRFVLRFKPFVNGAAVAWIRVRLGVDVAERFYGLGEWPDAVEHRGRVRPMQLEADLTLESANNEAHVPVPLLIGTSGWGVFVKSRRLGLFDVAAARSDRVEITYGTAEASAEGLELYVFGADRPLDVTRHYYDLTGDPLLPAYWALGPWIWRNENRDQAEVEEDIATIRSLDLATSAIWIDRPYAAFVNTFDFDPTKYSDPAAMISRAHDNGLRVALWHTPYLEEGAQPLLSEAQDRGFFPPKTGLLLNNWSKPIDFTNPEAYAFWQTNVRRYTAMGIEGFKLDYGEDIISGLAGARSGWEFFDGTTELTGHYDYTLLYHRLYAETLPSQGGFLLCRTGRWGDQVNVSVIWPGDMDADFSKHRERVEDYNAVGGLPATVIQGLGLGPSGFPFFGADTGGYLHSPPDAETYVRWFQQTALMPVMQVGDSSSQPPWVFDAENGRGARELDLYRIYARLHLRLFPYVWTYARQLADNGRAIARPFGLAHPELGEHPDDLYLLGDHLLVAPVVERGARTKTVVFPGEKPWFDWWTGERYEPGARVTVDAPLEKLPLFIQQGGIVPLLRPNIDTLSPATIPEIESFANDAGALHVRMVAGGTGAFELYDGTKIEQDAEQIRFARGNVFDAAINVELIGAQRPSAVTADGATLAAATSSNAAGWFHARNTLWINPPPATATLAIR